MKLSFLSILALIFITLKLTGYIVWSWWLVLAPIWAGWACVFILAFIAAATHDYKNRGYRR